MPLQKEILAFCKPLRSKRKPYVLDYVIRQYTVYWYRLPIKHIQNDSWNHQTDTSERTVPRAVARQVHIPPGEKSRGQSAWFHLATQGTQSQNRNAEKFEDRSSRADLTQLKWCPSSVQFKLHLLFQLRERKIKCNVDVEWVGSFQNRHRKCVKKKNIAETTSRYQLETASILLSLTSAFSTPIACRHVVNS